MFSSFLNKVVVTQNHQDYLQGRFKHRCYSGYIVLWNTCEQILTLFYIRLFLLLVHLSDEPVLKKMTLFITNKITLLDNFYFPFFWVLIILMNWYTITDRHASFSPLFQSILSPTSQDFSGTWQSIPSSSPSKTSLKSSQRCVCRHRPERRRSDRTRAAFPALRTRDETSPVCFSSSAASDPDWQRLEEQSVGLQ